MISGIVFRTSLASRLGEKRGRRLIVDFWTRFQNVFDKSSGKKEKEERRAAYY